MRAMKAYTRMQVQFHSTLTLALDGAEWSTSHSDDLTHWESKVLPTIITAQEARWVPKLVWTLWEDRNLFSLPGIKQQFLCRPAPSLPAIPTI